MLNTSQRPSSVESSLRAFGCRNFSTFWYARIMFVLQRVVDDRGGAPVDELLLEVGTVLGVHELLDDLPEIGRLDEPLVERGRQQVRAHAAKARVRVPGVCLGNLPVPCRDDGSAHENSTLATSAWTHLAHAIETILERVAPDDAPAVHLDDEPAGGVEIADDLRR